MLGDLEKLILRFGRDRRGLPFELEAHKGRRPAVGDQARNRLVVRVADGEDPALLDEPLAMLRSDRSTRETVELANAWSRDAIAALDPIPDGPVREALTRFAQAVADRSS